MQWMRYTTAPPKAGTAVLPGETWHTKPPCQQSTTLPLLSNCLFTSFLSNIALSSLLSNFVLTHFFFQPIRHKGTPPAFHPDARAVLGHRDAGETCGMGYQCGGVIHSLVNEMLLFVNLCKSGRRGETGSRLRWVNNPPR